MKALMVMYDSLNRRYLSAYGCEDISTPNFDRLAARAVRFDNCYVGSLPCMPARREIHTGRYNFLHRSWGPIEPFDDSMPEILKRNGIYTHITTDHQHYFEDGGATYHTRYSSWENSRGQEGDPWKGSVADPASMGEVTEEDRMLRRKMTEMGMTDTHRQDAVNREYLAREEDMPQVVTVSRGLEFIERNHAQDNWFLTIETFDPHEPFFASERFKALYPDPDDMAGKPEFDWPEQTKVKETPEVRDQAIRRYKALVSMCDDYLGKILDAMDRYDLWKDTLLIVNTDHGYLLGEHGWWSKNAMPCFNEIANTPLFIWDPRCGEKGVQRSALVQTIDIAPTVLSWFGLEIPKDMLGKDLAEAIASDAPVRQYALYGATGAAINVTDGRRTYMRSPLPDHGPLYEYTLMPTRMRNLFTPEELKGATLAGPFSFTKGCPVLRVPAGATSMTDPARYPDMHFDLETDPGQLTPVDGDVEHSVRLIEAIRQLMLENDAPEELYAYYGLSRDTAYTAADYEAEQAKTDLYTTEATGDLKLDRLSFLLARRLTLMMPAGASNQMLGGLAQTLAAQGKTICTAEDFLGYLKALPVPEGQKQQMLTFLGKSIEM